MYLSFQTFSGHNRVSQSPADIKWDLSVVPDNICILPTEWGYVEGKVIWQVLFIIIQVRVN
jgi:hypothetical protein